MSKKVSIFNITDAMKRQENWLNSINTKFKVGDVVEKGDQIGVVSHLEHDIEMYKVKWYKGPNPWDFIEGSCNGRYLTKSDKPNPLKYTTSQRYPGPASEQIDQLNKIFSKTKKEKTSKEIDKYIEILEEQYDRIKENKIDIKEVDSIVDEELEEDISPIIEIDPVEEKRKQIISEE